MVRNFLRSFFTILFFVSVTAGAAERQDVTAAQAKNMIDTNTDLIIVDVREYSTEFCGTVGHIPCALNYPWDSDVLEERYGELPKTADILVV